MLKHPHILIIMRFQLWIITIIIIFGRLGGTVFISTMAPIGFLKKLLLMDIWIVFRLFQQMMFGLLAGILVKRAFIVTMMGINGLVDILLLHQTELILLLQIRAGL